MEAGREGESIFFNNMQIHKYMYIYMYSQYENQNRNISTKAKLSQSNYGLTTGFPRSYPRFHFTRNDNKTQ